VAGFTCKCYTKFKMPDRYFWYQTIFLEIKIMLVGIESSQALMAINLEHKNPVVKCHLVKCNLSCAQSYNLLMFIVAWTDRQTIRFILNTDLCSLINCKGKEKAITWAWARCCKTFYISNLQIFNKLGFWSLATSFSLV